MKYEFYLKYLRINYLQYNVLNWLGYCGKLWGHNRSWYLLQVLVTYPSTKCIRIKNKYHKRPFFVNHQFARENYDDAVAVNASKTI